MAIPPPSPGRMNRFAIEILDAARENAEPAPIDPNPAVRLALAWLAHNGVAEAWQVEQFWKCITTPPGEHRMDPYCRSRDMNICVNRWTTVATGKR
ncbi:hypothetical protein [Sphingobium sp.]|uniref:hypothetical protein n=1 Tax=Sphingobium sp. TaxID=1912891 RepID=UPI002BBB186D|nr:hypothetical protein [Sphingobium sp.]HUD90081.1 hypothetical protein [Sphingobium sp.]